ncbi:MAG: phospholipase D/Transphosphatidylase, partial [Thermoleophilia bacterium]|nr:phospholipase D/Transphosphatidylase [Thermoleophilia bacterium]
MRLAPAIVGAAPIGAATPQGDVGAPERGLHRRELRSLDAAFARGTDWQLFDQDSATDAIVAAIDGARHVVDAEFFAIADAGKGARLVASLVAAAKRGVEVNLLTDVTSTLLPPLGNFARLRRDLEGAGGHVIFNSRVPFLPRVLKDAALRHVDHRKVVAVDGETSFVGGMNFTPVTDDYHDSMVRLTGVPAARLATEALDRWERVGGDVSPRHRDVVRAALGDAPPKATSSLELDIQINAPERAIYQLTESYRELIRTARTRVWITTPGLSDQSLIRDIDDAARRGVDVRIVTSGVPLLGVPLLNWVGDSHLKKLISLGGAGFQIPEVLHRKSLVVDDTAVLSSYNITGRS